MSQFNFSAQSAVTINAGDGKGISIPVNLPDGYKPLGVVGFDAGNTHLTVAGAVMYSNNAVSLTVNNKTSVQLTVTPVVKVLAIKA